MSKKILILTVGGACQPIVKSLKQNKPDFVYFICSDDNNDAKGSYTTVIAEGKVCGGNPSVGKPHVDSNIVSQANLTNTQYEIVKIKEPDNINECFLSSSEILKNCKTEFPESNILIDYTGGTKSMSSGIVLAATTYPDVVISLVAGLRNDLIKTVDGTEQIRLFKVNTAYLNNYFLKADLLYNNRDYEAVIAILENLLSSYTDIPNEWQNKARAIIAEARAFNFWDKFEHDKAYLAFNNKGMKEKYALQLADLRKILIARHKMDNKFDLTSMGLKDTIPVTGFELVFDLILNAERKALKQNFDDAIARIYRALEVFIQVHLKLNYSIETGNIDLSRIPDEDLKKKWSTQYGDRIKIGLIESYELLGVLNNEDNAFKKFQDNRNHLLQVLESRNNSILAHGFQSINQQKYINIKKYAIEDFLRPLIIPELDKVKFNLQQLPNEF